MKIKTLTVTNYRNYPSQTVEFCGGVNLFLGGNAQGKTNLLEAIYLSGIGRSERTPRDKELITWGGERARVAVTVQKRSGESAVEIIISKNENKRISVNSIPVLRIGELMGAVSVVLFSPDEMRIIKEAPSDRRRFMDIALCQISKAYFYTLNRYNRILSHRNRLLKTKKADGALLSVLDEQLAGEGAGIAKSRRGFIGQLSAYADAEHRYLTDGQGLELEYEGIAGESAEEIKANFLSELAASRARDLQYLHTGAGIQKDDIAVKAAGVDLRAYGSQGQQRTAALSLKLAELELANYARGEYPVLLLDDVLSELDKTRQLKLMARVAQKSQTVITATHLEDDVRAALTDCKEFTIKGGRVE